VATEKACTRASRVNGVTAKASAALRRGADMGRHEPGAVTGSMVRAPQPAFGCGA
jgi:hypothetical protein